MSNDMHEQIFNYLQKVTFADIVKYGFEIGEYKDTTEHSYYTLVGKDYIYRLGRYMRPYQYKMAITDRSAQRIPIEECDKVVYAPFLSMLRDAKIESILK